MTQVKNERQLAAELANRVLEKPYIDPDGDICLLARQFLRATERIDQSANLLTNIAQILDVVKGEWAESWSDWDQEQRDGITRFLTEGEER